MTEQSNRDILLMALFTVTRDDVLSSAREVGLTEAEVSEDVIEIVKERVSQGLGEAVSRKWWKKESAYPTL